MSRYSTVQHHPRRAWWSPWRKRCTCGWPYYTTCPDAFPVALSVRRYYPPPQAGNAGPAWNGPTAAIPLNGGLDLTPGQEWRSRQGGRWEP